MDNIMDSMENREWILYSEKIPNEDQDCWICQYNDRVTRATYCDHEILGKGFGFYENFITEKYIKCWMPYFTPNAPLQK